MGATVVHNKSTFTPPGLIKAGQQRLFMSPDPLLLNNEHHADIYYTNKQYNYFIAPYYADKHIGDFMRCFQEG